MCVYVFVIVVVVIFGCLWFAAIIFDLWFGAVCSNSFCDFFSDFFAYYYCFFFLVQLPFFHLYILLLIIVFKFFNVTLIGENAKWMKTSTA